MKLLVFSDSHGDTLTLSRTVGAVRDADYVIHAGDGALSFLSLMREHPEMTPVAVRGNCDIGASDVPLEAELTVEGMRILIVHGHKFGVKSGTLALEAEARMRGYDIVIFGHTHEPLERYIPADGARRAIRLFNPGPAMLGDFGVININGGEVIMGHGSAYGSKK